MLFIFIILFAFILDCKNNKIKFILPVISLISLNISYSFLIDNSDIDKFINYVPLSRLLLSVILICFGTTKLMNYANELDDNKQTKENKIKRILENKKIFILFVFMIIFGILFSFIKISNVNNASILFRDLLKLNGSLNKMSAITLYVLFSFIVNIIMFLILLLLVKLFNKTKISKASKLISGILFFIIGIFILIR